MILFAPFPLFFLKVVSHDFNATAASYSVVAMSVAVFSGTPLGPAVITRFSLRKLVNAEWYNNVLLKWALPWFPHRSPLHNPSAFRIART